MNLSINELKVLLSLNGGQRIQHLEQEIFADNSMTILYLRNITPWIKSIPKYKGDELTYRLSCYGLRYRHRWPEYIECIMANGGHTNVYDWYIHDIRDQFPYAQQENNT